VDSGLKFLEDHTVGDEVGFAFEHSGSVAFEKTTAQNLVVMRLLGQTTVHPKIRVGSKFLELLVTWLLRFEPATKHRCLAGHGLGV
jgi:hypothetical protein